MPTFIDESGDTGHTKDSSPFFRLAALQMPTNDDADRFRNGIRELRRLLKIGEAYEFKFSKTHVHPDRRRAFLEVALQDDFRFAVCSIDRTKSPWDLATKAQQHWVTAGFLAVSLRPLYLKVETPERSLREPIFVDDNGDGKFLKAIGAAFRELKSNLHPKSPMVRNPKFRGSGPDEVMQLVDVICGAAGAAINGDTRWFEIISQRCEGFDRLP